MTQTQKILLFISVSIILFFGSFALYLNHVENQSRIIAVRDKQIIADSISRDRWNGWVRTIVNHNRSPKKGTV